VTDEGEKLAWLSAGAVGAGSEQYTAQHKRAAFASEVASPLIALSQQSIIDMLLSECNGIPANTPPASDKANNNVVSQRFTRSIY